MRSTPRRSGAPSQALVTQSAAGARQAFDALSGEIHASAVSAAFDDARLPREAVLDRLAIPYGAPATGAAAGFAATSGIAAPNLPTQAFAAWGQAFGSFGRIGGDDNAATLDRSVDGFILGVDASLDNRYRLGVAGGYTQSSSEPRRAGFERPCRLDLRRRLWRRKPQCAAA